jgi:hypothetical protein
LLKSFPTRSRSWTRSTWRAWPATHWDLCRRRVQQTRHGHRGRKGDPLYNARRTLHTGADLLTDKQAARRRKLFASDAYVEVEATRTPPRLPPPASATSPTTSPGPCSIRWLQATATPRIVKSPITSAS